MVAAIEQGHVQREIQKPSYRYQPDRARRAQGWSASARTRDAREGAGAPAAPRPALRSGWVARLTAFRAARDAVRAEAVAAVERAAREGANVMPPIVSAVEAHATVGEIADALRAACTASTTRSRRRRAASSARGPECPGFARLPSLGVV